MREIVYLSEPKLAAFIEESRKPAWWRRMNIDVELSLPMFGKIAASSPGASAGVRHPTLDEVIGRIDNDGLAPTWLEPDSIEVGDWFYFECRLSWTIIGSHVPTVLFVHHGRHSDSAKGITLLMHGSAGHLHSQPRTSPSRRHPRARFLQKPQPSEPRQTGKWSQLLGQLAYILTDHQTPRWDAYIGSDFPPAYEVTNFLTELERNDSSLLWLGEAYTSGYAKLTVNHDQLRVRGFPSTRVLVATPLYVEYETRPAA
ncbi:SAVMC3_10250 family protein [Nonomuraea angiospora]|uniref:SAVMC3_10250 family protein n=1 Tax=Nonomuraea angiospora TaxID=46172 RepID=UPI003413C23D